METSKADRAKNDSGGIIAAVAVLIGIAAVAIAAMSICPNWIVAISVTAAMASIVVLAAIAEAVGNPFFVTLNLNIQGIFGYRDTC